MDFVPSIDELMGRSAPRLPGLGRKKAAHPPLPPEQEKSLLSDVLSSGTSALQYLGETLDKPGRAVRGVLAGKPKELLNLVPFSDTAGITDPSESVSGRDLLEKAGVLGANKPGFADMKDAAGDIAGFGAEVLTDPLSYLTFGASAVGKAGKTAKALGISTKGAARFKTLGQHLAGAAPELLAHAEEAAGKQGAKLSELLPQKLGGAFGVTTGPLGLLGIKGSKPLAQGPLGEAAIEGLGKVTGAIGRSKPALAAKGLFSHEVRGQFTPAGQDLGRAQTAAFETARPAALKPWAKLAGDLGEIQDAYAKSFGSNPLPDNLASSFEKLARMHAEGVASPRAFEFNQLPFHQGTSQALMQATQEFGAAKDALWKKALNLGLDAASMPEVETLKHSPRYPHPKGEEALARLTYKGTPDSAKARLLPTKFLPAGVIETIYKDPEVAAWMKARKTEGLPEVLMNKYGKWLTDAATAEGAPVGEVAKNLAEHLGDRPAAVKFFSSTGADLYGKLPADTYKYMTEVSRKVANMSAIHDTMKRNLVAGGVDPATLFKDAGMNPTAAMQTFGQVPQGMGVAPDVANAILSVARKTEKPEWLKMVGNWVDTATKPFKANVTLPWPSFATRNFASGQAMNFFSSEIPSAKDALKYKQEFGTAMNVLKDPAAHRTFIDELAAHRVFDSEDLAALGTELGWSMKRTPNPVTLAGMGQNVTGGIAAAKDIAFNPKGAIGAAFPKPLKAARAALAMPSQIGAEVNKQVEFLNRVPMYLYLRKHLGWTPEAAASKVRELQVDYQALAPFEKDVMRRLVPFYSWQRKIVPEMLKEVGQRPGGPTAQVVRASNTGRSRDEFVPPYVGEGMSVNLGGDRYLTGLGLPTDQLADLFVKGPTALGTLKRTGQKMLSQTNPLVKAPIEIATGVNTFTGQPIEESYPHPTGNVLLNQIIHNTPAARAATSLRQLTDERKGVGTKAANLLTGLRITDVSGGLEKQKRMAESKMLQELLREDPAIGVSTDVYQKKDQATGQPLPLSMETELRLRALAGLKKRAADEAKKRKKQLLNP